MLVPPQSNPTPGSPQIVQPDVNVGGATNIVTLSQVQSSPTVGNSLGPDLNGVIQRPVLGSGGDSTSSEAETPDGVTPNRPAGNVILAPVPVNSSPRPEVGSFVPVEAVVPQINESPQGDNIVATNPETRNVDTSISGNGPGIQVDETDPANGAVNPPAPSLEIPALNDLASGGNQPAQVAVTPSDIAKDVVVVIREVGNGEVSLGQSGGAGNIRSYNVYATAAPAMAPVGALLPTPTSTNNREPNALAAAQMRGDDTIPLGVGSPPMVTSAPLLPLVLSVSGSSITTFVPGALIGIQFLRR